MIRHIFNFELKYWFNRWQFYVYLAIGFFMAYLTTIAAGGIFDSNTFTVSSNAILNSAVGISTLIIGFSQITYFFLPAIFGTTISKDFDSKTHEVLYSYPFSKAAYFFGKFTSAFVVALLVVLSLALGIYLGVITPGINPDLLGPHRLAPYLKTYGIYMIPNLLFFGGIVFVVVSATRNIALGYVVIIILFFQDALSSSYFENFDDKTWGAILDPYGYRAQTFYTEYWTVDEQNNNPLPTGRVIWLNRAFWLALSGLLLGIFYSFFKLAQSPVSLFSRKTEVSPVPGRRHHGLPVKLQLPKVTYVDDLRTRLQNIWYFSNMHLSYIVRSTAFIVFALLGVLFMVVTIAFSGQIFETETYPLTEQMLTFGNVFFLFITILTFLFSGFLIHRETTDRMQQLVDVTPASNQVHLWAKFLAILKMQALAFLLIMVSGVSYQLYSGFYQIDWGHYLFQLLIIDVLIFVPWIAMSFLVHHLIPNKYVGFIILLALFIGIPFLNRLGIEQSVFIFNRGGRNISYSAFDGYGNRLIPFAVYRIYWISLGFVFLILSALLWRRGFTFSAAERIARIQRRLRPSIMVPMALAIALFAGMFVWIYNQTNRVEEFTSSKKRELNRVEWEKSYKQYEDIVQPRMRQVKVALDLMPEKYSFSARGDFLLVNHTDTLMDTLILNYGNHNYAFEFDKGVDTILRDEKNNIALFKIQEALRPGDSLRLKVLVDNGPKTIFRNRARVYENGSFLNSMSLFPSLGYSSNGELTDDKVRKKYDLPPKERMAPPTDTASLQNNYIRADWIDFEATISTAPDQIAIAPGYLQEEWEENGRKYFRYKMDAPILAFLSFVSGRYEVYRDKWNDVNLEIYYHKDHDYNIDRMIRGLKDGLDYFTANFGPYQHRQVRIIEFPSHYGGFAQSFANTIPYSESVGFIAKVDDSEDGGLDYPFAITAHELAHQWWAHQVVGADVQGATLMSESLSEYSSLKVLEKAYGKDKMRIFLKDALDKYLQGRTIEQKKEKPLMYNENQPYIHYNKGSLILYALSDYIGETNFNAGLRAYVDSAGFQEAPFTTSLEFVDILRKRTPDSLQYLIKDMFETITLYNNRIQGSSVEELPDGRFKVNIEYQVRKYRANEQGKAVYKEEGEEIGYYELNDKQDTIRSLPLADYIEVGVFGEDDKELYLQKHKINGIFESVEIIVDEKPKQVGIDPYNKLIDTQSGDNRKSI